MIYLTKRQKQILKLIAYGLSTEEISKVLCIGTSSVSTHTFNLFAKLGIFPENSHSKPRVLASLFYWQRHLKELEELDLEKLQDFSGLNKIS